MIYLVLPDTDEFTIFECYRCGKKFAFPKEKKMIEQLEDLLKQPNCRNQVTFIVCKDCAEVYKTDDVQRDQFIHVE